MEHVIDGCLCKGKICTKCGQLWCREYYEPRYDRKCGSHSNCKKCRKVKREEWKKTHPDRVKIHKETHRKKHPHRQNPQPNTAIRKEQRKQWKQNHPDQVKEQRLNFRQNHPDYHKAYQYNENIRRTRITQAGGNYTRHQWLNLCSQYNHTCLSCGRTDVKLCADHIIPVSRGGTSNIENIQPLCKSCNSKKRDKIIDYRL